MRCVSKKCPFKNVNADNCHFFNGCDFARPQPTNADRIRAMTGEELAKAFSGTMLCVTEGRCHGNPKASCYECWLNWLNQPAKEET